MAKKQKPLKQQALPPAPGTLKAVIGLEYMIPIVRALNLKTDAEIAELLATDPHLSSDTQTYPREELVNQAVYQISNVNLAIAAGANFNVYLEANGDRLLSVEGP